MAPNPKPKTKKKKTEYSYHNLQGSRARIWTSWVGTSNSTAGKALALHVADQSLMPVVPYDPQACQERFLGAEPKKKKKTKKP